MTECWEPGIIIIDKSNNTYKSTIVRTDSGRMLRRKSRFLKKQSQCLNYDATYDLSYNSI